MAHFYPVSLDMLETVVMWHLLTRSPWKNVANLGIRRAWEQLFSYVTDARFGTL